METNTAKELPTNEPATKVHTMELQDVFFIPLEYVQGITDHGTTETVEVDPITDKETYL